LVIGGKDIMSLTSIGVIRVELRRFEALSSKGIRVAPRIIVTPIANAPASSRGKSDNGAASGDARPNPFFRSRVCFLFDLEDGMSRSLAATIAAVTTGTWSCPAAADPTAARATEVLTKRQLVRRNFPE
jgi:hypothetical protein